MADQDVAIVRGDHPLLGPVVVDHGVVPLKSLAKVPPDGIWSPGKRPMWIHEVDDPGGAVLPAARTSIRLRGTAHAASLVPVVLRIRVSSFGT